MQTNTFTKTGQASLYNTTNSQYGSCKILVISAWAQDGIRP